MVKSKLFGPAQEADLACLQTHSLAEKLEARRDGKKAVHGPSIELIAARPVSSAVR
jgi:hypothetical protein